MELTGSPTSSGGFFRRIRSQFSESSSVRDSMEKLSSSKSTAEIGASAGELAQFHEAVKTGNRERAQQILDQHPEFLDCKDAHQNSALHLAVISDNVEIVRLLAERSKDLSSKDGDGSTALHLAAAANDTVMINLLLSYGADIRATNDAGDTVLHLAARCGSVDALETLLETSSADVNIRGWNGETPLHVAASQDEVECAKVLVLHHAEITRLCSSGAQAVHYAASSGSLDFLRYILQIPGVSAEALLKSVDDEEATPLHLAVNRGDGEVARVLLEAGAPITSQMFELSTPLHIACALGAVEIVELMHDFNVVDFEKVLAMTDAQGMTPVHRAAMFNHWNLLRLLIEKHASLNARDASGRTVLVLAASRGSWDAVSELLGCGSDALICSNDGQNFLHCVVALGGDPEAFKDEVRSKSNFGILLNGKDNAGLTPLHYAAQCGFGNCCDTLVRLGALITAKSHDLKTPLHLAAEFGRYTTMKRLLTCAEKSPMLHGVVNESDNRGRTPLHLAAAHGHLKIVLLLLSKGSLMARDLDGSLPLHLAGAADQKDVVEALISSHTHLLDALDKKGNTVLHVAAESNAAGVVVILLGSSARSVTNNDNLTPFDLAVMNGHQEVAEAMVDSPRWKELLLQPSSLYTWPTHGLIQEFPSVMMKVLDKCQTSSGGNLTSKEFNVTYDYRLLQPDLNPEIGIKGRDCRKPLEALNQMTHWKRVELLCHPVCTTYLEAKWWTYGLIFHFTTLTLYITFLTLLTYLVLVGIDFDLRPNLRQFSKKNIRNHKPELLAGNITRIGPVDLLEKDDDLTTADQTLLVLVICFALIHLLKKILQLKREGILYFVRPITLFELTLYVSTMLFTIAFYDVDNIYLSWQSQWLLGAVSIFFAWVNLFFYLRRYGEIGVHVMILLVSMKMLTEAMVVLFVVVVAFSITFYTLNPNKILPQDPSFYTRNHDGDAMMDLYWTSYSDLPAAILRVSDQMIGDADVIVNFIDPILNGLMIFPILTYLLAMVSIVVVTILLQSLIIGLTVGKIRYIRETVTLRRKIMQVDLHTEIEEKFSAKVMAAWDIAPERTVFPNQTRSRFLKDTVKYFSGDADENSETTTLKVEDSGSSEQLTSKTDRANEDKLVDDLSAKADQQHELLRMVIQYMNIQLEADVMEDEDVDARRRKLSRFVDSTMADSKRGADETD